MWETSFLEPGEVRRYSLFVRFSIPKFSSSMFISSLKLAISQSSQQLLSTFFKKRRDALSFVGKSTVLKSSSLRSHSIVEITKTARKLHIESTSSLSPSLSLSLTLSSSFNDSRGTEGRCSSNKYAQAAGKKSYFKPSFLSPSSAIKGLTRWRSKRRMARKFAPSRAS